MCNVTDVLWPQCRIHLDHFYKPGKKYLPQLWKPRQQVWDQLFIQTEMPPGNNNIYPPELGGLISQLCTIRTRAREGWQAERGAGSRHGGLLLSKADITGVLLLSKAGTSLVSVPVGPAESKERRHCETTAV